MLKSIVVAVLLLGFGWAYPPTRARMMLVAQPVLERMGPVGDKVLIPVQRYSTRTEIKFILDQISLAKTEGKEIPEERTFNKWVTTRLLTKNNGKDPWDQKYYLVRVGSQLTVGSIGKDGKRGTDDDVKESMHL
jgi:Type II secretion system (T2SS), protein G